MLLLSLGLAVSAVAASGPELAGALLRNLAAVQLAHAKGSASLSQKAERLEWGERFARLAVHLDGGNERSYLLLARLQLAGYRPDQALETLSRVRTDNDQSLSQLAALYHHMGMDRQAATYWAQARATDRLAQLGQKAMLAGDAEVARLAYLHLWDVDPVRAREYCYFGVAWIEGTERLDRAIRLLRSDDGGGRFAAYYPAIVELCAAKGDPSEAHFWQQRLRQAGG